MRRRKTSHGAWNLPLGYTSHVERVATGEYRYRTPGDWVGCSDDCAGRNDVSGVRRSGKFTFVVRSTVCLRFTRLHLISFYTVGEADLPRA